MDRAAIAVVFLMLFDVTLSQENENTCLQMYQSCIGCQVSDPNSPSMANECRKGKQGPRGHPGPKGDQGIVNYDEINEETMKKLEETESRIDIKLAKYEKMVLDMKSAMKRFVLPTGCENVHKLNAQTTGGLFEIWPTKTGESIELYCDLETDNGGWTVFQRRMDGSVDFYRANEEFVNGFGDKDNEFWLGLEKIHQLTKDDQYELRIDMEDWANNTAHALYRTFSVGDGTSNYQLTVGDYSGNAGDSLTYHNSARFTAKDLDLDSYDPDNCARLYKGGWWYKDCHLSNLNGKYIEGEAPYGIGVVWKAWKGYKYSLKFVEMKFRKK